jgi:hypothetical protein
MEKNEYEQEDKYENNLNAVEQFKKRFKQPDLVINRIPEDILKWFNEKAQKEFCGDYGMLIKWLVDSYRRLQLYEGEIPNPQELINVINQMQEEINELKLSLNESKTKTIKTLSGRVIKRKEE